MTVEEPFDYTIPEMVVQCGESDVTIQATDNEGGLIFTWLTDPPFTGNPLVTNFDQDGFVTVIISKEGSMCPDTQQVEIAIEDVPLSLEIQGGNNQIFCGGDLVTINLLGDIPSTATISWTPPGSGNETSTSFEATASNTVAATVTTANGCEFTVSIPVNVSAFNGVISGPSCIDNPTETLTYTVTDGAMSYNWTANPPTTFSDPTASSIEVPGINRTTTFMVTGLDAAGCPFSATYTTEFREDCDGGGEPNCDKPIRVPTVFTPNGDGVNDILRLALSNSTAQLEIFIIYDRWGNEIFTSNSINNAWDGRKDGAESPQDVYGYYAKGTCESEPFIQRGNITLLR